MNFFPRCTPRKCSLLQLEQMVEPIATEPPHIDSPRRGVDKYGKIVHTVYMIYIQYLHKAQFLLSQGK